MEQRRSDLLNERGRLVQQANALAPELRADGIAIDQMQLELQRARSTVEQARPELRAEHAGVSQSLQELSSEKETVEQARREREATSDQIGSERGRLDTSDASAVASFNDTVDSFNSGREEFNRMVDQYNGHKGEVDRQVDRYQSHQAEFNGKVGRYNSSKDEFNRRVRAHNDRVRRGHRISERLRRIDAELER